MTATGASGKKEGVEISTPFPLCKTGVAPLQKGQSMRSCDGELTTRRRQEQSRASDVRPASRSPLVALSQHSKERASPKARPLGESHGSLGRQAPVPGGTERTLRRCRGAVPRLAFQPNYRQALGCRQGVVAWLTERLFLAFKCACRRDTDGVGGVGTTP